MLAEAIKILSTPEGSLVYYLLVLWTVLAALSLAGGEWRRARTEHAQRVLLALMGVVLAFLAYALAGLAAWIGLFEQQVVLPPTERFVTVASLGLLAWAFMPSPQRGSRVLRWVLGLNLVLATGVWLVFTFLWGEALAANPALNYNSYWQSTLWAGWQLAVVLSASVAVVRDRGGGWGTLLVALAVALAGTVLQFVAPADLLHLPVWQRMANLLFYPLLAVGVYQDIVAGAQVRSRDMEDISQASLDQIQSLLTLLEMSQQTSSSLDLTSVLESAVKGIAQVLNADQCAIVFPEEEDSGTMRLVAIHNPMRQGRGESVTFPLDYQLTVQQAMRRKKAIRVEESENVQLKVLFALLGSGETGPLLVQPLLTRKEAIGAIIAGNSRSRRPFSADEAKMCQSLAQQVTHAIQNARLHRAAQDQVQMLSQAQIEMRGALQGAQAQIKDLTDRLAASSAQYAELGQREESAREARNALEIQLASSQAEVDALSERLADLEADLARAEARAETDLRRQGELARAPTRWQRTGSPENLFQVVVRGMTAGALVTDEQGVVQEANLAAEVLLNQSADELEGLMLEEISPDEHWLEAVAAAREGRAVRLMMQVGLNALVCDLAPLLDPEELPPERYRMVVILQDVSIALDQQHARLAIIATLTEELRTPITTIINYADLLLGEAVGILGTAQRKFLTRIKAGAERMAQMTNELGREVGAQHQWLAAGHQLVDVSDLIEATVATSCSRLEDREIDLRLDLGENLPAVKADPDSLRRVVANLLSNACLATSTGGQVRVEAIQSPRFPLPDGEYAENGDGFVIVSVTDSGDGLSEEALNQVFDRSRPSQTPQGLGESGAGMALVRTLVEAHGGRLWVETEKGVGTTFSFVLPVNNVSGYAEKRQLGAA